jgi:hypothetical protein
VEHFRPLMLDDMPKVNRVAEIPAKADHSGRTLTNTDGAPSSAAA